MKFLFFLIFCAFFSSNASLRPDFSETLRKISNMYRPQTYSMITDIIKNIIKSIEGVKEINVKEFPIDPHNRFDNITIKSDVNNIVFLMGEDDLKVVDIKNLTIPVSSFLATGEYDFEDISLLGLNIYGKGNFQIKLVEFKLFLIFEAKYSSARGWKVNTFEANTSMKECKVNFENLMNGEPMGDFINFMANEILKLAVELAENFIKEYNEEIKNELTRFINNLMGI